MDIFAAVKKFALTVFTVLGFLFAIINARNSSLVTISETENIHSFSPTTNQSQSDLERSNSYHFSTGFPTNRNQHSVIEAYLSPTLRITGIAFTDCIAEDQTECCAKEYLRCIYPSHNFW